MFNFPTTIDLGIDKGKTPEQLCAERAKRLQDVIDLKVPDRIPINLMFSYMLSDLGGVTKLTLHEDPELAQQLLEKAALYYQPDTARGVFALGGPQLSRLIGDRMMKWPGYGLGDNDTFQYAEGEYMKAEDYEAFLLDPGDWSIRTLWPRVAEHLGGLALLPHLGMAAGGIAFSNFYGVFAHPKFRESIMVLKQAADYTMQSLGRAQANQKRMETLGFPPGVFAYSTFAAAPFDAIADTLRGIRGVFLDMHRRPDQLLEAIDKMRRIITQNTIETCKALGLKYAGSMLHRGSDGFMSLQQFETFYWPSAKKMWLDFVDAGITPLIFYEGTWDQRLDYLAELPKGKTVSMWQSSDIFRVKEVLGDQMVIMGGMPNSMLHESSPDAIRAFTRRLCEEVGEDGGFMMGTAVGELQGCKPELVKAWVDATKEFGQYKGN